MCSQSYIVSEERSKLKKEKFQLNISDKSNWPASQIFNECPWDTITTDLQGWKM